MNPWLIVSWIGAVCVAILIIALTVSIVVSVARSAAKPRRIDTNVTNIFNGK